MRGVNELPKTGVTGEFLVLRAGQLGTKSKVLERVFMQDAMDEQPGGFLFEVDPIVAGPVSVKGAVRTFDRPEAIGMTGKKIRGQDVELTENLHLQGGGKLADFRGAGRGEDDLKGRHAA